MGKKAKRVPVNLDAGDVAELQPDEISAILRAADELIGKGGRTLLSKILKGSKEKRVLELGLDQCPSYGYYHDLRMDEIGQRVDWMIKKDYLRIEYDYRLPVIVYSPIGWEIEKRQYTEELYQAFCNAAKKGDEAIIERLKEHTNRQVILILLEIIEERGDPTLIPFLEKWREIEVKKLKSRIEGIIKAISERQPTQ